MSSEEIEESKSIKSAQVEGDDPNREENYLNPEENNPNPEENDLNPEENNPNPEENDLNLEENNPSPVENNPNPVESNPYPEENNPNPEEIDTPDVNVPSDRSFVLRSPPGEFDANDSGVLRTSFYSARKGRYINGREKCFKCSFYR